MQKSKLTIDLPEDLKTEFKIYCAVNKMSMTDVVERLIREYIAPKKSKDGKEANWS